MLFDLEALSLSEEKKNIMMLLVAGRQMSENTRLGCTATLQWIYVSCRTFVTVSPIWQCVDMTAYRSD
jgi:hypothetical protein